MIHSEPHFLSFIHVLEAIKVRHGDNSVEVQERQVNGLIAAEKKFRTALVRHPWGADVYQDFIKLILEKKHNILMARPYFRERDKTFKTRISQILRKGLYRKLYRFHLNFQFVSWVVGQRLWQNNKKGRKLLELAEKCRAARATIIEANLPLAISQARAFFGRNRYGHQEFMDMIQVAAGGLAAGVDKFVGPYTKTFRAVLIGRILGDLIEANSETFFHFFPTDKRRLYRVRKILAHMKESASDADYDEVIKLLNLKEKQEGEDQTTVEEVQRLMAAAMVVHAGSLISETSEDEHHSENFIERFADDPELRPDKLLEEAEMRRNLSDAILRLSVLEQKLLRLKGVDASVL